MVTTLTRTDHPAGTKLIIRPIGANQQGLYEAELLAWSRDVPGAPVMIKFDRLPGGSALDWVELNFFNNHFTIVALVEQPLKAPEAVIQIFEVVGKFADALKELANPKK